MTNRMTLELVLNEVPTISKRKDIRTASDLDTLAVM